MISDPTSFRNTEHSVQYRFHANNGLALLHEAERLGYVMDVPEYNDSTFVLDPTPSATEAWRRVCAISGYTNLCFYDKRYDDYYSMGWAMIVPVNEPYETLSDYGITPWIEAWDKDYEQLWGSPYLPVACVHDLCLDRGVGGFRNLAMLDLHYNWIHGYYHP